MMKSHIKHAAFIAVLGFAVFMFLLGLMMMASVWSAS